MASNRVASAYLEWKALGLRRKITQDLADRCGVAISTLYLWKNKPVTVNGKTYQNWDDAYDSETKELRANFEHEINDQLKEQYKLADIWATEVMMKAIVMVKKDDYEPTIEEIKTAIQVLEKQCEGIVDPKVKDDTIKQIAFNIGFRGDKVGDS